MALLSLGALATALWASAAPVRPGAAVWGEWASWGDQGDGTYRNPVLPSDYSDIDCIRVGEEYYAISSTFHSSPGMVILRSRDLVNWTIAGHAIADLTQIGSDLNWDRMRRYGRGVWAGAIRHHAGKFWIYFGTPDEGYFMTTAKDVAGPWKPLHAVLPEAGWDDCCPFWDGDGQGWLVGSNFRDGYQVHLWKLTPDSRDLVRESDRVIYRSRGSEANKLYQIAGTYYHLFSEVAPEGRVLMMRRAKNIEGPWEGKRQLTHGDREAFEPNQGGLVEGPGGQWYFFTHHGRGSWEGRAASLLPVTWRDGWPLIGAVGPDGIGSMTWSGKMPLTGTPIVTPQSSDEFSSATLGPQWEWNYQPRADKWSLAERPGFLRLHAFPPLEPDDLRTAGNTLTQRTFRTSRNVATVALDLAGLADGQVAGLAHFTRDYSSIGVRQQGGLRRLEFRRAERIITGPAITAERVRLRSEWGLDGLSRYSYSLDGGAAFTPFGEPYQLQWAQYRGDRLAIFSYNTFSAEGYVDVDWFHYDYAATAWRSLLDEKLSDWETWMGSPHVSVGGLPQGTPRSANARDYPPMGLGNDPKHVFSVGMEAGEPVLHVTGEIWGGLTTRESFSNYHLRLDVKWGEKKWEPRLALPRNSGLLYHCTGPHGAFWNAWKRSLEFEVQENDMGDLNPLGGTCGDVMLVKPPSQTWIFDPVAGEPSRVGDSRLGPGWNRARHLAGDFEKPNGEWNTLELYAIGRTAVHVVNGHVVNVVRNLGTIDGASGAVSPLDAGQLQLQSEGAEVFYRRIQIRPIAEFPVGILRAGAGAEVSVPRWEPHDFVFTAPVLPENPFRVAFSAEITGPGGARFSLPGFYDGDRTWKIRVSPTAEGAWSLVTHSDLAALDGRRAGFGCAANRSPAIHGSVRLDAEHPHQFVCEDGTRFLPVGYECDWLWALDAHDPGLKTINPFLDRLTTHGFNLIVLNAYAHDTTWRKGRTGDDDFGPPPLYAWAGTNERPDHSRFNLAFWQHYDRVIDALYRRGIWAHVLMKVYNKQVNWPANGTADDGQYFRWLIARYAAYPNITWDLAKEAHYEKDLNYKLGRLRFIRANDPYHRLLTVHDDRENYDRGAYDALADYRSDQQHQQWRETMLAHRRQRAWPVINTEFGYECGPAGITDKTYRVAQSPEEVLRRAWEVCLAGGFGVYYYTYTAWDVVRVNDTPPGYAYCKHLRDFLEETSYWRMRPMDGLASAGSCLAEPGREYIVFLGQSAPFTLKIEGAPGPLAAEWYQPLSGARRNAGSMENGLVELRPPGEWRSGPVVLHVGSAAASHPAREGRAGKSNPKASRRMEREGPCRAEAS